MMAERRAGNEELREGSAVFPVTRVAEECVKGGHGLACPL